MIEKLKPCPFCGYQNPAPIKNLMIQCTSCFASALQTTWNTRTSDEKLEKCIQLLKHIKTAGYDYTESSYMYEDIHDLLKELGELP